MVYYRSILRLVVVILLFGSTFATPLQRRSTYEESESEFHFSPEGHRQKGIQHSKNADEAFRLSIDYTQKGRHRDAYIAECYAYDNLEMVDKHLKLSKTSNPHIEDPQQSAGTSGNVCNGIKR